LLTKNDIDIPNKAKKEELYALAEMHNLIEYQTAVQPFVLSNIDEMKDNFLFFFNSLCEKIRTNTIYLPNPFM
jgi:hypothetical protein